MPGFMLAKMKGKSGSKMPASLAKAEAKEPKGKAGVKFEKAESPKMKKLESKYKVK